jgi:polysaccharide export outer membrane protein
MRTAVALLVALTLAGCGHPGPVAPSLLADDPSFSTEDVPPPAGLDPGLPAAADLIYPGDVLSMRVLGASGLDIPTLPVDRSGRVHLPLAGDVLIGNRTLADAEALLTTALTRHDRFARPTLSLIEAKGRFATVVGAVEKPGNVPLLGEGRLVEVLASVGGARVTTQEDRLVPLGDLDGTRVVRSGQSLPVDLRLALQGNPRHNIPLLPGDIVYVPPVLEGRITILGHVARARTMGFRRGLRLTEALAEAGGLTRPADLEDVRILRGGLARPRVYVASMNDVLAARRPDVELAPGDVVFVSEHWFASVTDVLEKIIPTAATVMLGASVLAKK